MASAPPGSMFYKQSVPTTATPSPEKRRRRRRRGSSTDEERDGRRRSRSRHRRLHTSGSSKTAVPSPERYPVSGQSPARPLQSPINVVFPHAKVPAGGRPNPAPRTEARYDYASAPEDKTLQPQQQQPQQQQQQPDPSTPVAIASPPLALSAHPVENAPHHVSPAPSSVPTPASRRGRERMPTPSNYPFHHSDPAAHHPPPVSRAAMLLGSRRDEYQKRRMRALQAFDDNDLAPEDRARRARGRHKQSEAMTQNGFDPSVPTVCGTFAINGVNYSTYEAHKKERPLHADRFLDALRDDVISEVGNGVRREDILFAVSPGAIQSVALKYDEGSPRRIARGDWVPEPPKLLTASWSFTVDFVIRARNDVRQKRIAEAMYQSLTSDVGVAPYKTPPAYVKFLDPTHGKPHGIKITRPVLTKDTSATGRTATAGHGQVSTMTPPATRAVSPVRAVPVSGMYPQQLAVPEAERKYQARSFQEAHALQYGVPGRAGASVPPVTPAVSYTGQRQTLAHLEREDMDAAKDSSVFGAASPDQHLYR
eukprot:TRINITY_DN13021_c0_g1_i1.p1 TRINITY_DN13021_c0_g1~~TRINITY_DN13021_c0_g1_i1.p1  ORF type:complete len:552 (+),score=99.07 TRINITY_DN13021_c0_g1_i1:48-1658(+)